MIEYGLVDPNQRVVVHNGVDPVFPSSPNLREMVSANDSQSAERLPRTVPADDSHATTRRTLLLVAWLVLVVSWGASTWIGLEVVQAVYRGELSGGLFDDLLTKRDVLPLSYYRAALWQRTSIAHVLGFLMLVVVYTWRKHSLLLSVLLVGDVILVGVAFVGGPSYDRLSVHSELGLPASYQHLKEISIIGCCVWLYWHR